MLIILMSSEYDSGCLFCQKEKGIKPLWRAFLHKNWVILPPPPPTHSTKVPVCIIGPN